MLHDQLELQKQFTKQIAELRGPAPQRRLSKAPILPRHGGKGSWKKYIHMMCTIYYILYTIYYIIYSIKYIREA